MKRPNQYQSAGGSYGNDTYRGLFGRYLVALLIGLSIGACSKGESDQKAVVWQDGFVIGNDTSPLPALVVGIGDSISQLLDRNPFLRSLGIQKNESLRLPLLKTTDVTYDDGRWKIHVGCSTTSDLDGGDLFSGLQSAGFNLCGPSLNAWSETTRRASEFIDHFKATNPDAVDIADWLRTAKESEWRRIGGDAWSLAEQRNVVSVEDANIYFSKLSRLSKRDAELAGMLEGARLGIFLSEKVILEVSVIRVDKWGGDSLTESQRNDRNYVVVVRFAARRDVPRT